MTNLLQPQTFHELYVHLLLGCHETLIYSPKRSEPSALPILFPFALLAAPDFAHRDGNTIHIVLVLGDNGGVSLGGYRRGVIDCRKKT